MKKTRIILLSVLSLLLVLGQGCKKKPAGEESTTSAVSQSQPAQPKTQAVPQNNQPQVQPQVQVQEKPVAGKEQESAPVWMTDIEAAKKKAVAESKDLLLDFTGSDWCPGCIQLEKEVLSRKVFIHEAQKHFVFVIVDFPRKKEQSPLLKQQNEKLAQQYDIQVFPTVLLADVTGKPYAEAVYEVGGPLPYLQQLAQLQQAKKK
jgi:thioredoxin-related protein